MKYIGFDIGGTKCAVSLGEEVDESLKILDKKVISTDLSIGPYEMIDKLCKLAEQMVDRIECIGISVGGPLSSVKGEIYEPYNLPGWVDVKIVRYLKEKYNNIPVFVLNDANACALAEWKYGAGKGSNHMIFLTAGTGMGAGMILNGRLYQGANELAGEVGRMRLADDGPIGCGKNGSFEGFCSGGGIGRYGRMIAEEKLSKGETLSFCASKEELDTITAKKIAEYAHNGCEDAIEIYKESGRRLGQALAVLIDVINPEVIVIGSIYQRSGDLLIESMINEINKEACKLAIDACDIRPALLEENIGDYAALTVAILGVQNAL